MSLIKDRWRHFIYFIMPPPNMHRGKPGMNVFEKILDDHHIAHTVTHFQVLKVIFKMKEPTFSIHEMFVMYEEVFPGVSKEYVLETIQLFKKQGLIKETQMSVEADLLSSRFELTTDK